MTLKKLQNLYTNLNNDLDSIRWQIETGRQSCINDALRDIRSLQSKLQVAEGTLRAALDAEEDLLRD